jgi:transcriptional regulator NrdR family protein
MDKRLSIGGYTDVDFYVWRRRRCKGCGKRYTTLELSIQALDKLTGKVKENGDGG